MWCTREPQQPSFSAMTTSMPCRLSTRIADSLVEGASTGLMQPASSATRHRRPAEQRRVRQNARQQAADKPVGERPLVGLLDMVAGVIDEVHVVHARGARRHAGEAREAAVDVLDHLGRRRTVLFQHLLDQVDAAARGIQLVAEQHIGRARGGAEAAMHAGAQDLLRFGGLRISELGEGEGGLHYTPAHMRPGLSTPMGSKLSFPRLFSARTPGSSGWNTSTAARTAAGARTSVAWPPSSATAVRTEPASGSSS